MKRIVVALALSVVTVACGSSPSPEPKNPEAPVTANAASAGPCTATLTTTKQPGWSKVGVLTLAPEDKGLRTEVRDVSGKVVPTENAPTSKEGEIKPWIIASTCKLGGVFAYVDKSAVKPTDKIMTFELYKPAKDDEPGDLASLCTKPSMDGAGPGLDPSQEMRIAAAHYDETLGSRKWREWFSSMSRDLEKTEDVKALVAVKKARGEELAKSAKAAGKASCWFANALRGE